MPLSSSQESLFQEVLKISSAIQDAVHQYLEFRHTVDNAIGLEGDLSELPYADSLQLRREIRPLADIVFGLGHVLWSRSISPSALAGESLRAT